MEITGRLTKDATVRTLDNGRQVVSFSIVDNEIYMPKGATERKQLSTFFNCSYWLGVSVAKVLKKGATVLLSGRISAKGYTTNTGDIGASLEFMPMRIKVLSYAAQPAPSTVSPVPTGNTNGEQQDDLPF